MKGLFIVLIFLGSLVSARDLPWLGVALEKAGKEAQNGAGLGNEVGLVVSSLNPDGPCAKSMGQSGDLWWKFDGQILVSKCQMVVLLRAKKAGDEVSVEFYRDGKLHSMQVVLGARPDDKMYSVAHRFPGPPGAERKLLTRREEVAHLSVNGHDVSLKREGESLKLEVRKEGEIILSEMVDDAKGEPGVTGPWLESYQVLKLTLDQHASTPLSTPKHRVRYVPRNQGSKE